MKMIKKSIAILFVLAVILFLNSKCASTKIIHLSGDEFVEMANDLPYWQMGRYTWAEYVGSSTNRAYIEWSCPADIGKGSIVKIYWTEISDLPNDFHKTIKKGAIEISYDEIHAKAVDELLKLKKENANQELEPTSPTPVK